MSPLLLGEIVLDDRSVAAYLELRILGAQPVSVIARRLGMPRTTAYYMLERLSAAGLVTSSISNRMRLFEARPERSVFGILQKQRKQLKERETEFKELIRGHDRKYGDGVPSCGS